MFGAVGMLGTALSCLGVPVKLCATAPGAACVASWAAWMIASSPACGIAPESSDAVVEPARSHIDAHGAEGDLVGTIAPEFEVSGWIVDGQPTRDGPSLSSLRGRVVLVRFWTDTCPYCRASAPGFAMLDRTYRDRGLTVIGIHHPKPRPSPRAADDHTSRVDAVHIADVARAWGLEFAIGLDDDWRTVDRWWLTAPRAATSATFLLDRRGVVRWVHPGPELHPGGGPEHARCREAYAEMSGMVETLLREGDPAPGD